MVVNATMKMLTLSGNIGLQFHQDRYAYILHCFYHTHHCSMALLLLLSHVIAHRHTHTNTDTSYTQPAVTLVVSRVINVSVYRLLYRVKLYLIFSLLLTDWQAKQHCFLSIGCMIPHSVYIFITDEPRFCYGFLCSAFLFGFSLGKRG